ncbi:NUDIX domain-containing protein [Mycobacterium avium]|uniref:NUDIX domain-containing protein n=1 Tax=Mycobacterium avium TaxID=1764 RepID=UPI000A002056|nr:NUDIX domain-containing protein [Mycobacterium avium]
MANGFDADRMPCSPCVARLQSPAERLEYLRTRVRDETDPLVTLTHLLHLCRDEHQVLWTQVTDPGVSARVTSILQPVTAVAASRRVEAEIDPPLRAALADALVPVDAVAPVVIAHALAQFLDEHYPRALTASFHRRSPYQPAVGDPMPLGVPDIREVIQMHPTSPPWRLANRVDETRHVRLAGGWATQFRVVFDYSAFDALAGLVSADTIIATCHPNRDLSEFRLPADTTKPAFPVRPSDLARQQLVIDRLIAGAVEEGASIVVLPELCVTESLAHRLQEWVSREDGPRLLVAGSYHHRGGFPRKRANTAISWVQGHPSPLMHDKHSPAEHPIVEDIQPQGWPELRVYVTADGWHLMVAICRDLLNPEAVHALTEAGANLVLVPAMSETLAPFTGQIGHLVSSGQAFVAVANNPADWSDGTAVRRPARALFGHPGLGQQVRLIASPDSAPGIAAMRVRSALIGWTSADYRAAAARVADDRSPSPSERPGWVASLSATLRERYPQPARPRTQDIAAVMLRRAAVLVLLTNNAQGPRVLLTERAPDLSDYPGRLTFPGGVCEPGDADVAETARREAAEEIGLDPASVQLVGLLPAVTDPESRFLVTPVVAFSDLPRYAGPANLAEVASVREVELSQIGTFTTQPNPAGEAGLSQSELLAPRLGSLTATVIDLVCALLGEHTSTRELGGGGQSL